MDTTDTLDTIWEIDDVLWELIEPLLKTFWPAKSTGRPPANWRQCLNGIIYQMRTGCQGNKLPKQFGDASTVHRWFQRWAEHGVLERLWTVLVEHCDQLRGVQWKWQAADGSLAKARFGGPMSDRIRPIGRKTVRRRTSWLTAKVARWR
jgi:putative transposase